MKKLVLLPIALFWTALVVAQVPSINSFYRKYKHQEETFHVKLPGFLVRIATGIAAKQADDDPDALKAMELMKGMRTLRVLTGDGMDIEDGDIKELLSGIQENNYEELMQIRKDGTNLNIFFREKKDFVRAVFILARNDSELTLLSLKTKIKYADFENLMQEAAAEDDFFSL